MPGGGGGPSILRQPIRQVKRARRLRKEMSLPEVLLWIELRKRPGDYKWRKQFALDPYTLDFTCLSVRLTIEVDGEAHDRGDQARRDDVRDRFVTEHGFAIIRIPAVEVLKNMEGCIMGVVAACAERGPPPPSLRDGPPPRAGEDF
ncbi:endonuclease domain-containing protein [Sphingomonas tabacisoli]|uniref:Endonuclease domain-containing protein n=1 Tax=Sphingomonas tabacisoli TaxID=2249466 RepID=A0ABW4I1E1_9SPHN